jgi:Holliday junction resolvase
MRGPPVSGVVAQRHRTAEMVDDQDRRQARRPVSAVPAGEEVVRRAARRDSNEAEIVRALEAVGAAVQRLSEPGCPDLLVSFRGVLTLIEVKLPLTERGAKSQRREAEGGIGDMTAAQVKWWREWRGKPPVIVRTVDEALYIVGALFTRAST